MGKEAFVPRVELGTLAASLAEVFIWRWDLYARQLDDGSYICVRKPLTPGHLLAHLGGSITLGTYALDRESRARFIAFDADDEEQMVGLVSMSASLASEGVPSYLETSRRGGHLWLFFSQAVPGRDARLFGGGLLAVHGLADIELFPKQGRLRNGPGSLIRLPFGVHRRRGRRYGFITPDGRPLAPSLREQVRILCTPGRVPPAALETYRMQAVPAPPVLPSTHSESCADSLSQRLKDNISVLEFVSRFVELSPTGRGLCPFHDDQRASFSVNVEENYWHCFAGCGGGSVIDFWMKLRACNFTSAVHELAEMLLQDS